MLLTPPVQNHIPANRALHRMPPKDGEVEQVPRFQMYLGDPRLANAKHLPQTLVFSPNQSYKKIK